MEAVKEMKDQAVISTFKNILNEPHRATTLAARTKNLNEAIQITSKVIRQQNSIMHFYKHKRHFTNRKELNYANTYNNKRCSNNNQGY